MVDYSCYMEDLKIGKRWVNRINSNYFCEILDIKANMDKGLNWYVKFNVRDKSQYGKIVACDKEDILHEFISNWMTISEKAKISVTHFEKMQNALKNNLGITATDSNGDYRPVYDILNDINVEWGKQNKTKENEEMKPTYKESGKVKITEFHFHEGSKQLPNTFKASLIDKIYHNENKKSVTILLKDGRKGTSKCLESDSFDLEYGILLAFQIAVNGGNKTKLHREMAKAVKKIMVQK